MGPRASKTLARLRERALLSARKATAGPQSTRERKTPPAIVQSAVVKPAHQPPPPRAFQAKSRASPLGTIFTGRSIQSPRITVNSQLVPVRQPISQRRTKAPLLRQSPQRYRRTAHRGLEAWVDYGMVHDLQSLLKPAEPSSAVLVAIDTESERHGLINHVVEVGISALKLEDVRDTEPGEYLRKWNAKLQHRHLVIDITRHLRRRMHTSLFGSSMLVNVDEARNTVLAILRSCASGEEIPDRPVQTLTPQPEGADAPGFQLCLVGQSISMDLTALKGAPLEIDVRKITDEHGIGFGFTFDTLLFSERAFSLGADMPSKRLGHVAKWLGIDPVYHDPNPLTSSVKGTHNAINDAAYSMMVALKYAQGRDSIATDEACKVPPSRTAKVDAAVTSEERARSRRATHHFSGRRPVDKSKHLRRALIFVVVGAALAEALLQLGGQY